MPQFTTLISGKKNLARSAIRLKKPRVRVQNAHCSHHILSLILRNHMGIRRNKTIEQKTLKYRRASGSSLLLRNIQRGGSSTKYRVLDRGIRHCTKLLQTIIPIFLFSDKFIFFSFNPPILDHALKAHLSQIFLKTSREMEQLLGEIGF